MGEAKGVMVQGTSSHAGKSILTSALCRILAQDGYRVAPFKSQNMALNSFVTKGGGEIGRAQAVQSRAAKVIPTIDMNPILLKPREDNSSQVIIHGRAVKNMTAREYFSNQSMGIKALKESLGRLEEEYDLIVAEGAGSPAEINLRDSDIVNMKVAREASLPVILVADIDLGGVFASIIGTFELLNEEERGMVKGIVINKFRGDPSRLKKGIDYIEKETGVPVLGIIPYFKDIKLPEEDSLPQSYIEEGEYGLEIGVLKLPHLSNFTDFDSLALEPSTRVSYLDSKEEFEDIDLLIIPGTKNTIDDLNYLYKSRCVEKIINFVKQGKPIIGICGGYQMLGKRILDPSGIEGSLNEIKGLGLLDIETRLEKEKVTTQVKARSINDTSPYISLGEILEGYEIHLGRTSLGGDVEPIFRIEKRSGDKVKVEDGAISSDGMIWGTYLHGIFDNDLFRRHLIDYLREEKGLAPLKESRISAQEEEERNYNRLADLVRENLDMDRLYQIMGVKWHYHAT